HQHRGTIEVKSEGEGQGSTFILTLPLARRKAVELLVSPKSNTAAIRLDGLKALVVDDNVDNLYLFDIILKSLGVEVKTAESAQGCLQILSEFKPDVLISDISMPGEDGYSLIRKIRAKEEIKGGKIPAIALTAYAAPEDIRLALEAGFSGHVAKPVDKQILAQTISKLLDI
ncbi:MAG: response regulator, partial [Bdellovibrio sp.]